MHRVPVVLQSGDTVQLSPGGHGTLVKRVLDDFCSLFTPGGRVIYVGDTGKKWAYFDASALRELGMEFQQHEKMPDVVVHYQERSWLVLIEAVVAHGPINPARREELGKLFAGCKAGIVYVTAFATRRAMSKYVDEISWETEVWIAESPTHMVHFNGERFLGPYE
jgi:type II restriction enzyme